MISKELLAQSEWPIEQERINRFNLLKALAAQDPEAAQVAVQSAVQSQPEVEQGANLVGPQAAPFVEEDLPGVAGPNGALAPAAVAPSFNPPTDPNMGSVNLTPVSEAVQADQEPGMLDKFLSMIGVSANVPNSFGGPGDQSEFNSIPADGPRMEPEPRLYGTAEDERAFQEAIGNDTYITASNYFAPGEEARISSRKPMGKIRLPESPAGQYPTEALSSQAQREEVGDFQDMPQDGPRLEQFQDMPQGGPLRNPPPEFDFGSDEENEIARLAHDAMVTQDPETAESKSEDMVEEAAINAGVDDPHDDVIKNAQEKLASPEALKVAQEKKKKDPNSLSDSEKIALALIPALTLLAGGLMGGEEGALIAGAAMGQGVAKYGDIKVKQDIASAKSGAKSAKAARPFKQSWKMGGKSYAGMMNPDGSFTKTMDSQGNFVEVAEAMNPMARLMAGDQMAQRREGRAEGRAIDREGRALGRQITQEGRKTEAQVKREGRSQAMAIERENRKEGRDIARERRKWLRTIKVRDMKIPTDKEWQAALYFDESNSALKTFDEMEKSGIDLGRGVEYFKAFMIMNGMGAIETPFYTVTDEDVALVSAKRAFINSVIRPESGAAITQSEWTAANVRYFPSPMAGPKAKAAARTRRNIFMKGVEAKTDRTRKFISKYHTGQKSEYGNIPASKPEDELQPPPPPKPEPEVIPLNKRMNSSNEKIVKAAKKVGAEKTIRIGDQVWRVNSIYDDTVEIERIR